MDALLTIIRQEAKTLRHEFEKASELGEGTSQEIADFRENAVTAFLQRFYPHLYRIVKGKIRDSFTKTPSQSIDCVVVNPAHPNLQRFLDE